MILYKRKQVLTIIIVCNIKKTTKNTNVAGVKALREKQ